MGSVILPDEPLATIKVTLHVMNNDNGTLRPFLKWAGNKIRLIPSIKGLLPQGKRLIEPFVGSGAVFLNTDYKHYLLSDINPDLIQLYQTLQRMGDDFIDYAATFFVPKNNTRLRYQQLRKLFNSSTEPAERSALFIYLNRHCYNGLCRYNKSGGFNVPFGLYKQPYFPALELRAFYEKAKHAKFICGDYRTALEQCKLGDVVYCDPPYIPLSATANFTNYSGQHFHLDAQQQLATLAENTAARGIPVLLSNHDTPLSREYYKQAQLHSLQVRRFISCQGEGRQHVAELLALFV